MEYHKSTKQRTQTGAIMENRKYITEDQLKPNSCYSFPDFVFV